MLKVILTDSALTVHDDGVNILEFWQGDSKSGKRAVTPREVAEAISDEYLKDPFATIPGHVRSSIEKTCRGEGPVCPPPAPEKPAIPLPCDALAKLAEKFNAEELIRLRNAGLI